MLKPPRAELEISRLDPLLGTWEIRGRTLNSSRDDIRGQMVAERMPGALAHVQRGTFFVHKMKMAFVEVVWYDPKSESLRAHVYGSPGAPLRYAWQVRGSTFIHSGLGFRTVARLSKNRRVLTGSWRPIRAMRGSEARAYDYVQTKIP